MSCPRSSSIPSECPMKKEDINPNNKMPEFTQTPDASQKMNLSTQREKSTIPKSEDAMGPGSKDSDKNWYYPSPQQFYHALKRKDMAAPEENISTMVDIHNFLNEQVWNEILKWENHYKDTCATPTLSRFEGKANNPSLKSKWTKLLYNQESFDRHDWTIDRCGQSVRYIIDYYEGEVENGNPSFYCDVRPAFDSPSAIFQRMRETMKSYQ